MTIIHTRITLVFLFLLIFTGSAYSQVPVASFTVNNPDSCAPFVNVTFTSTSTNNPTSFTWDFGDGAGPFPTTNAVVQNNYANPGSYTVTLIATNGSGSSAPEVRTNFITVFANPQASFTTDIDTACSGSPINFTDNSIPGDGAINLYSWSFQDGSAPVSGPGLGNIAHSYDNFTTSITSFTPQYLVSDLNGCSGSFNSKTVFIKPDATAEFGVGPGSTCSIPATIIFTNASAGPAMYSWDFGDPGSGALNTSTAATPSHVYNASGSYLVTLVNGFQGCTSRDTMTVNVFPPVAGFTVSDDTVCIAQNILFTNTSTPTPLSALTFQWNFGDGTPSNFAQDPSHSYINPGTYTVTLTTRLGSCSSTATHTIYVPPRPTITFSSPDPLACNIPFDVTFNADTTPLNVGWLWDFGDPGSGAANTSTSRDPLHTYSNFGSYSVKLVVTSVYGCIDSVTLVNYVIVEAPTVDFSVQDSGCVGKIFNFNAVVTSPADPVIDDYTWDFGDGSPTQSDTVPGVTHQYNTVGIYDVTLTITTQSGCTATLTKPGYARVGTPPTALIDSVLDTICFKGTINFTDLTPAPVTGWLWFFGDGQSSTDRNPGHKYEFDTSGVADPFDIILIAYYNGCSDTDTVVDMIVVLPPIPLFDTTFDCLNPNSVTFTNLSGGADAYSWNFGDGSPLDTTTSPVHTFPGPGPYTVVLSDTNFTNGCKVDTTIVIQITNLTAVAASNVISGCRPLTVQFTGSGSSPDAMAYQWTFGEGIPFVRDTSTTADTIHLYNRPGLYTATLTTRDLHQCIQTDTQVVHVLGPTADFMSPDPTGCTPSLITFRDNSQIEGSNIVSWTWDFGTGEPTQTTTIDSIVHPYNSTGTFTVRLTVTDANGCSHTHSKPNYVSTTKPTAGIIMPDNIGCVNAAELITGSAGPNGTFALPVTYTWDFGDGGTSSGTSSTTSHTYTANGFYTIDLKVVDNNGCRDSIPVNIDINTTPAAFTLSFEDTCVEVNDVKQAIIYANFNSTSNNLVINWNWDLTVFNQPVWTSPDFFYAFNEPPGAYDVSLTVTNSYGCTDTHTEPGAIVIPGPTGSFSFTPKIGCRPLTVEFTGVITNTTDYLWYFGDGQNSSTAGLIVQHTYTAVSTYYPQFYLGFQLTNSFCYVPTPVTDSIIVTSLIDVDIIEDSIVVSDGERDTLNVTVTNGTPPFIYNWTPASAVINGPTSTSFLATTTGTTQYYYVVVPYGTQGCSGLDSVLVIYKPCEALLKIPNVFTPDGNFLNDTYYIEELCNFEQFQFRIFNRWGKIIYESTDPKFKWDGTTTSGSKAAEGVYYYVLTLKTGELHGYIDLIRSEN